MKRIAVSLLTLCLLGLVPVRAEKTTLAELDWQQLAADGKLKGGQPVTLPDGSASLKIENPGPGKQHPTLFTIEQPAVTTDFYAVTGEVRYDQVAGDGYLEMWNHFAPEAAYFTRTLGTMGPMQKLSGTSDWRPFALPFNATGAGSHPARLVINAHLPGKGTVYLRNVKLVQSNSMDGLVAQKGAWWSDRGAGLIGGIGGVVLGCLGSFMEWAAQRGKSRGFVLAACKVLIGLGAVSTALGTVALGINQPYAVWFALVLLGVLCVAIFPFRLRRYQDLYRQMELRRMSAMDLA